MHSVAASISLGIFALLDRTALIYTVIYLSVAIVLLWPAMRILSRAGYPQWWAFGVFVPGLNVALFYAFALREWPAQYELARLRAKAKQRNSFYVEYQPRYDAAVQYGHHN